ncbi:hypothetical protein MSAN_01640000 [Mycena sanguinolenta]|uniref:Uncharacterized protein n=1 Tax=Mycena sanguinolenta TaxID=230812 RepID=A0A8H7CWP2_9AGAR|nr:hypothetical protein MSAN_01640000 [Mycena sanguinolenta]
MFNFKALFTAILLAASATTAWGKAEAILYANASCTGGHSPTIGLHTGDCHSTLINGTYAKSVHFYTNSVPELYYYYTNTHCSGTPAHQTDEGSICYNLPDTKSFKKAA